jgi:NAD(P)-dependent dehydrogenase (short-subunit alcohol dehydrogenase family)
MSKVWLITGVSSGIGSGTARAALKAGDSVVATARNLDKARKALNDVAGDNLVLVQLDVNSKAQAKSVVEKAVARFGRIDVAVNNAGYCLLGNFEETPLPEIEAQFATNFYGVVHVMRAVLPVMRKQRSGHIINIGAAAGVVGLKHCGAYSATKFASEGLGLSVGLRSSRSASRSRPSSPVRSAPISWTVRTSATSRRAVSTTTPTREHRNRFGRPITGHRLAMLAGSALLSSRSPPWKTHPKPLSPERMRSE